MDMCVDSTRCNVGTFSIDYQLSQGRVNFLSYGYYLLPKNCYICWIEVASRTYKTILKKVRKIGETQLDLAVPKMLLGDQIVVLQNHTLMRRVYLGLILKRCNISGLFKDKCWYLYPAINLSISDQNRIFAGLKSWQTPLFIFQSLSSPRAHCGR